MTPENASTTPRGRTKTSVALGYGQFDSEPVGGMASKRRSADRSQSRSRVGGPAGEQEAIRRPLARPVQLEAASFGILKALNDAFINPLLIERGASSGALGIYHSGANLLGFGAGWLGPRVAAAFGSERRAILTALLLARTVFAAFAIYTLLARDAGAETMIALVLLWGAAEGLVLPLWASFIAGLVGPGERGRWLAMRATAATLATVPVLAAVLVVFLFSSRDRALPIAYVLAACAGFTSLAMVARLLRDVRYAAAPQVRSLRSIPAEPGARRFLGGVCLFWFGAGLIWPILPAYIINDLGAPPAYFAIAQLVAALVGVAIQRRWGRLGDQRGALHVLLLSGIGASLVPALWGIVPVYWLGLAVELFAFVSWPGHTLGLTLRSVELARNEGDRSMLLGWTSLAQGVGACASPLIASALVGTTGVLPILFASAGLRAAGALVMSRPTPRVPEANSSP
jgi:MFS family permease